MPIITIREEQPTESGFTATLSFDHRVNFPIAIHDPLAAGDERRWEWYFEEWLRFPMLNTVKANQVQKVLKITVKPYLNRFLAIARLMQNMRNYGEI